MVTKRLSAKPDLRRPIDTQAKGLRVEKPRINEARHDIRAVAAYEPGIKGAKKPKSRKWY